VHNCGGYEITVDETTWAEKQKFAAHRLFGEQGVNHYGIDSNME
jgi:hypothetical protein